MESEHWVTSLFDLTFAEPIRWANVRVQNYGLSTYLDWSLVELWSK